MSEETQRDDIAKRTIVHQVPGMDAVAVRKGVEYGDTSTGPRTMDIYSPPGSSPGEQRPAVVLVLGFSSPMFATGLKDTGAYTSWGRLLAASGLVAVTYSYSDPMTDLDTLLERLRRDGATLGIDGSRIGLWAASGNVPRALMALMQGKSDAFRCAALCYGYMLDLGASTGVAEAAARFGFVHAGAGKGAGDLPADLPLCIARAGRDAMPHLNETIDGFVAGALARNLPLTLVNHASGPHAFDLFDDSAATRETIRTIVQFLQFHLAGGG